MTKYIATIYYWSHVCMRLHQHVLPTFKGEDVDYQTLLRKHRHVG